MNKFVLLFVIGVAILLASGALRAQSSLPPEWAYGAGPAAAAAAPEAPTPAAAPAPAPDVSLKQVPGSAMSFTLAQVRNAFGPADWFPGDHPVMPAVVAKGKAPDARACSLCHYPNGKGRAENAGIAGLPVAYFLQQLDDFRHDLRKSAEPRKANTNIMIGIAKALTEDEMQQAAEYFGAMKWTPWVRVVETTTVPKTRLTGGLHIPLDGGATEPIGMRIIEVPENVEQTEMLRNPRSGFVAYAPPGSIKKGEELVTTGGNGRTVACGVCHGADLKGMGPVPGLAGRSPSYLTRQMYDMQAGTRHGQWAELMQPVVAKLTDADFMSIAAYVASRTP